MATNFEEIKNILLKTKNEKDKKIFTFGYLFNQSDEKFYDFHNNYIYKEEFLKFLNEKYSKNLSYNNNEIIQLINQIQSVDNIPLELLSKYYVRIYTLESDFYRDINESLGENKILYYLPYIKVLYEGIKLKSLLTSTYKILYSSEFISNNEFQLILKNLNNKDKKEIFNNIIFSKRFLSFSPEKIVVLDFLRYSNKKDMIPVIFILDNGKEDNYRYLNKISYVNTQKISKFSSEKEILFFPFSSFVIESIEIVNIDYSELKEIYQIKIKYLGHIFLKESLNYKAIKRTSENKIENFGQLLSEAKSLNMNFYPIKEIQIELNKKENEKNTQNELEIKIKELNNEIILLNNELKKEKNINNDLNQQIKELKDSIKNQKENNIKINNKYDDNKDRILELFEELRLKDKEIRRLQEIKSRYPFELLKGEKIVSLVINSYNESIQYPIICKNTDIFYKIENLFYDKYPFFKKTELKNYFMLNGKRIIENKNLDENGIKYGSLITFYSEDN